MFYPVYFILFFRLKYYSLCQRFRYALQTFKLLSLGNSFRLFNFIFKTLMPNLFFPFSNSLRLFSLNYRDWFHLSFHLFFVRGVHLLFIGDLSVAVCSGHYSSIYFNKLIYSSYSTSLSDIFSLHSLHVIFVFVFGGFQNFPFPCVVCFLFSTHNTVLQLCIYKLFFNKL